MTRHERVRTIRKGTPIPGFRRGSGSAGTARLEATSYIPRFAFSSASFPARDFGSLSPNCP
jgi:hypothetical protein